MGDSRRGDDGEGTEERKKEEEIGEDEERGSGGKEERGRMRKRRRRKGRKTGRARRSSAHPTFPSEHLKDSLVLMVLEEAGGYVLLNHLCSTAPRPASHRAPTHGASCPCCLRVGSGCTV